MNWGSQQQPSTSYVPALQSMLYKDHHINPQIKLVTDENMTGPQALILSCASEFQKVWILER